VANLNSKNFVLGNEPLEDALQNMELRRIYIIVHFGNPLSWEELKFSLAIYPLPYIEAAS
jgi:hypothetical protein